MFCDSAVCVDDVAAVGAATVSCDQGAFCVVRVHEPVPRVDARCDDGATCFIDAENADVSLQCSDGSTCDVACAVSSALCTIECGADSSCSLTCGGDDVDCPSGETCACPV